MKKIGFALATVAAFLFVAGCASQPTCTKAPKVSKVRTSYHSKLGKMTTKKDVKK